MNLHDIARQIESHVRCMQEVVREVFLDDVSLVAAADDEFMDPV
jgi:cell division protein ZapA (FtsZ GTPase activity inhibitor)